MRVGVFAVFGADVAADAGVGTNSNGGTNGQGSATISGGRQVFEADDVVLVEVKRITRDGQIGNQSAVSDVTVFDSLEDYQAWQDTGDDSLIKYNYAPQNPGQTANVQSDLSGLGDGYVKFNSNVLLPQDGGPSLGGSLIVAPGTNIGVNGGAPVQLDHVQDFDLNHDGDTDDAVEAGDGMFFVGDYVSSVTPICFMRGTLIATATGQRPIESLRPGDLVQTLDNGLQPLRWVGCRGAIGMNDNAPIHFATGSIGNHSPLAVSPNHRVLKRCALAELLWGDSDVLVAAKFLVGQPGVEERPVGLVFYHHLMFDRHEIVLANGALCESLLPDRAHLHPFAARSQLGDLPDAPQAARRTLYRHEVALLADAL
ncbi:Hint domain-containing protein [Phaeobacter sp. HF9A]|uniref:Hint domain-containing protein n=1 Tax=Phaeobacter sp. HF9A TaxID=2721561 RepID=UPI00142F5FD3|nr:Hint domain-containing protein [Phaeobacter sp. HF9A]NIZ14505.1 Hint domain-containing protein [Phaeobacter sp. HF9A]